MCRNRFGILDDLYNEFLSEGINDVKFVGINGYAYLSNSYDCMVCSDPSSCSNCEEERIIPWVQDYPFIFNESFFGLI